MNQITLERRISGTLIREGAGVKLQRFIGVEKGNPLEPFLLFDYFNSTDPLDFIAGFPLHPHRGFETVTYVLAGQITHRDNLGRQGAIGPGDVQWMTAGRGIIHSEMLEAPDGRMQGIQLWLNLPAAQKMQAPRYQEFASDSFPIVKQEGVSIKVIAGSIAPGSSSPIDDIASSPLFLDLQLSEGSSFNHKIPRDHQGLVFVIHGNINIANEEITQDTLAVLTSGIDLTIHSKTAARCLLLAAARIHEPIVRHGPFVMNTQEEIIQALADFRAGAF